MVSLILSTWSLRAPTCARSSAISAAFSQRMLSSSRTCSSGPVPSTCWRRDLRVPRTGESPRPNFFKMSLTGTPSPSLLVGRTLRASTASSISKARLTSTRRLVGVGDPRRTKTLRACAQVRRTGRSACSVRNQRGPAYAPSFLLLLPESPLGGELGPATAREEASPPPEVWDHVRESSCGGTLPPSALASAAGRRAGNPAASPTLDEDGRGAGRTPLSRLTDGSETVGFS